MDNYCAFSKNHKCIKWMDYEITRHELEEADTLCHGNWIEIEQKNQYIQTLQSILDSNHISYPRRNAGSSGKHSTLPITTPSIVSSVISKYFERVFLLKRYSSFKEVNISEIFFVFIIFVP